MTVHLRRDAADADHRWDERVAALAQLIARWQPSLIAAQRGYRDQIEALGEALPGYEALTGHRRWLEEVAYPALYCRSDDFEVSDARDIWLSETPRVRGSVSWGASVPAVALLGELEHRPSGRTLYALSVQLDPVVERARLEQAGALLSQLAKEDTGRSPVVLLGVFHERPEGAVHRLLTGRRTVHKLTGSFIDVWRKLGRPEQEGWTDHDFGRKEGDRLDWIMVNEHLELQDVQRFSEPVEGVWPSDHFPVGAELLI